MSIFTQNFDEVVEAEEKYLKKRRAENGLDYHNDDPKLTGIALSGGGVRSATFCLGVLQALARKGVMKTFDYMSTVSGGGYIGSCLTSLLSRRSEPGLDPQTFPFTGLGAKDAWRNSDEPTLNVRHQIHHLRTHGEYLIPRSHLFSRDVQRALGSTLSGAAHTLILFALLTVALVAGIHALLSPLDPGLQILANETPLVTGTGDLSPWEVVKMGLAEWYDKRVEPPFAAAFAQVRLAPFRLLWAAALGAIWTFVFFVFATVRTMNLGEDEWTPKKETRSGWTRIEQMESAEVSRFNLLSVVAALATMVGFATFFEHPPTDVGLDHYLLALLIPLSFSIGGMFTGQIVTHILQGYFRRINWRRARKGKTPWAWTRENRFRRSLYSSLRGACIFGSIGGVILPTVVILLFSLKDFPLTEVLLLGTLAWARLLTRKGGGPALAQLGGWLRRPMANAAVLLFLALAFAWTSGILLDIYPLFSENLVQGSLRVVAVSLGAFLILGTFINANRTSPHYFYRDRLAEAYLKTDARSERPERQKDPEQGMPLKTLRDDEDLRLSELGDDNGKGPYHLLVASLNLGGSRELNRKTFHSDHFVFSRDYVGSDVTGWVETKSYRNNTTRLARVMAISAAAVASAMGRHTFGAQAFMTTLFNARLGYWVDNPWFYRTGEAPGRWWRPVFWPYYLFQETLGRATARARRVNVSDGGHTGDNLGLMPLLRRRCSTIVVCDAEADPDYTFSSFNNAVRMAFTEENITIEIDLSPIMTRKDTAAGFKKNRRSVVVGRIQYPARGPDKPRMEGRLVYIKSSVSGRRVPVHVENYAKDHEDFPQQTTADQFFDDAQFEAYRALGEHLGEKAAKQMP